MLIGLVLSADDRLEELIDHIEFRHLNVKYKYLLAKLFSYWCISFEAKIYKVVLIYEEKYLNLSVSVQINTGTGI
jgi:hypothetical protein